jgi:hypothetical protein
MIAITPEPVIGMVRNPQAVCSTLYHTRLIRFLAYEWYRDYAELLHVDSLKHLANWR